MPIHNEVFYRTEEFYLSYNPTRQEFIHELDTILMSLLNRPAPQRKPETAICIRDGAEIYGVRFLILYGDHREALKPLAKQGLEALIHYFNDNIHLISPCSDMPKGTRQ